MRHHKSLVWVCLAAANVLLIGAAVAWKSKWGRITVLIVHLAEFAGAWLFFMLWLYETGAILNVMKRA